jgi:rod shape determining protein RodA
MIGMFWAARIRVLHTVIGLAVFAAIIGSLVMLYHYDFSLFSKIIKPHQLHRIQTFINPASDPTQSWHVMNSEMAISSGGLTGEGFLKGQFIQAGYIPYDYADSIYVVIAEEFGFAGSAVLLFLYFFLIYRMINITIACEDLAGSYLVIGVISMMTLQIFENIAMHIGLLPLTGIALPFVSYGGSSLLTNMIAIGLVQSVSIHRHQLPNINFEQLYHTALN